MDEECWISVRITAVFIFRHCRNRDFDIVRRNDGGLSVGFVVTRRASVRH